MASAPAFAATPNNGSGLVPGTLDASLTAPTNVTVIFTAGTSGSKVEEIRLVGVGTTVASVVNLFRYDGATYHLIDQFLVPAVSSSTTALAYKAIQTYANLLLKNGDTLRVSNTVAGNVSNIKVSAFGGDF